jgi:hypothetical protein
MSDGYDAGVRIAAAIAIIAALVLAARLGGLL